MSIIHFRKEKKSQKSAFHLKSFYRAEAAGSMSLLVKSYKYMKEIHKKAHRFRYFGSPCKVSPAANVGKALF